MTLYNTMTRKKEEFKPLTPGKILMYTCGLTVYNYMHIGNARTAVMSDCFRRYLLSKGYEVIYASNYTDIDDKIIQRAGEENIPPGDVAARFMEEEKADSRGLNILPPSIQPKATEVIPEIIGMIKELTSKGLAYEKNGSVFYNTGGFPGYGKLSGKNIEELEAGARVDVDGDKTRPSDFVLWKPAKPGEPKWESPWGYGRPGWHIECSAMISKHMGETIDIHCGGDDLVFPHHENEIAQSEGASGRSLANYWLHAGMMNIDGRKMSKSAGNFYTIRDLAREFGYGPLRFFLISAHYRSPVNFSLTLLKSADSGFKRILNCLSRLNFLEGKAVNGPLTNEESGFLTHAGKFAESFEQHMEDDFNTAGGLGAVFDYARFANTYGNEERTGVFISALRRGLENLCEILGLSFANEDRKTPEQDEAFIENLINQRQEARNNKDYKKADEIRDQLKDMGVLLEDTPAGVRRTTKERNER